MQARRHVFSDTRHLREASRVRVVYVGHVARMSGGEIAMARLIDALPEVDAHVILAEQGPLVERLRASGVSVEVLPMRERTRDLRKERIVLSAVPVAALIDTVVYAFRLARRLRALRPDIVHTNTLKAGVYGTVAARLAGLPSVWHVRDRIAPDYLPRFAVRALRGLIATIPSAVIANSEATRATLRSAPERTRIVHSMVHDPISSPAPRAASPRRGALIVGMVGRLAPWKGQDVFLEAFAKAFPGGHEHAVIVGSAMFGEAERDYARRLRELAASLGIAERVEFAGFRSDVWGELLRMDVFVHASITPEPFGQVIVEAMLAGIPVVAAGGGGPREIISDGVDGLLYTPGDSDALAVALRSLAEDPERRRTLSENAQRRAQDFSPQVAAASVMALYREVRFGARAGARRWAA